MAAESRLLVIIGITGNQGGSVARTFLTDPSLVAKYRLRGVTRNASSETAQSFRARGVEMVEADLHDIPSLRKAFEGANIIFSITDFWKPFMDPQNQARAAERGMNLGALAYALEYEQGRNVADAAAKIPTLQRLVVSMTCSPKKMSGGRYQNIYHFDAKGDMIDYIKTVHPGLARKMSELNMGAFFRAWRFAPIFAPNRRDDGTFVLALPCNPNTPIPFVDPANDTGPFVRALLSLQPGVQLYGESEMMTWNAWLQLWGKTLGKVVRYEQITPQAVEDILSKQYPKGFGFELGEMYEFMGEYGYSGGDPACKRRGELNIEIPGLSSVQEYILHEDWSLVGICDHHD
ncbi:hypothetical protein LTR86_009849 [Recurvomyces mirabilis]|nr:hypothetical protein LTR86_009849 [Recurvomyces mirabilis]